MLRIELMRKLPNRARRQRSRTKKHMRAFLTRALEKPLGDENGASTTAWPRFFTQNEVAMERKE